MCTGLTNGKIVPPTHFRVDRSLGKLLKWLRILGYDAISDRFAENSYQVSAANADDRIWITKTKLTPPIAGIINISAKNPIDQLRQVIVALRIQRHSLRPFTRCSACNSDLINVDRETVRGQVPDYIWETHRQFRTCNFCQKIFWPGSHVKKQRQIIDQLFE
jgi:hypothetical protein